MVASENFNPSRERGSLIMELLVAMALMLAVLLPVAYSFASEHRLAHIYYEHAVAMEIADGEMEALAAGGWRAFPPGAHPYPVDAQAAANLPPGRFTLTIETNRIRLEWQPSARHHGGPVVREFTLK